MGIARRHTWQKATFIASAIALCITVDIFQHSLPLPFLPQELESQGHSALEIASVMGSYYWSGFLGGMCLTSFQIHRVLFGTVEEPSWTDLRGHMYKLMFGLSVGCVTLVAEALNPQMTWISDYNVHFACRFAQGFLGAFLFFYSYLLSVALFEGQQQVMALTMASVALNVAEVFGPFIGATIFTYHGIPAAYWFLAVLSVLNNFMLSCAIYMMPSDSDEELVALMAHREQIARQADQRTDTWQDRLKQLGVIIRHPDLVRSVLVIVPAALVKSCFEAILPFFAGNHMYSEFQVGNLFTIVAVAYIITSVSLGYIWESMSSNVQTILVAVGLCGLAYVSAFLLVFYHIDLVVKMPMVPDLTHHELFYAALFGYGVLLGLTHTPAAYMLGNAIDGLDDVASKDAANGIWNTAWEMGGSAGFVLAGYPATDNWRDEQWVLGLTASVVCLGTVGFLGLSKFRTKG